MRGATNPVPSELLQRIQNIEAILGITGVANGPGQPNTVEITGDVVIRDTTSLCRVIVGLLPSGDYGLYTQDPMGVANEVWPISSAYGLDPAQTTTSITPTALTGTPSVSAYIGASGDALVTLGCYIGLPTLTTNVTQAGYLQLNIDGSEYERTW